MAHAGMDSTTMTFRDYLRPLFRQKWVVLLSFITVVTTVFIGVQLKTSMYKAQATLLISAEKAVEGPYFREFSSSRASGMVLTQSELVKTNPVLERTVNALGLAQRPLDDEKHFATPLKQLLISSRTEKLQQKIDEMSAEEKQQFLFRSAVEKLRNSVEVTPVRDTDLFKVAVYDYNPLGTKVMANALSRSYVIYDLEQQLANLQLKFGEKHASVQQLQTSINNRIANLNGETVSNIEAIGPASVKVVEQAAVPLRPQGRAPSFFYMVALVLATCFSIFMAYLIDYSDQTVRSRRDVEKTLGMSYLGAIPKRKFFLSKKVQNLKQKSAYYQAYKDLADELLVSIQNHPQQAILLFGPTPNEGVSTVTANLAHMVAARSQARILVVDAHLSDPSLHTHFGKENTVGFFDVLQEKVPLNKAIVPVQKNLSLLPAGESSKAGIACMKLEVIEDLIEEMKNDYDLILIDAANTKTSQESLVIAEAVDHVTFVVREGKTRSQVIQSLKPSAPWMKSKFKGVILNAQTHSMPKFIYDLV